MSNPVGVISKEFRTQYANGDDFTLNPSTFGVFLKANVGDLVQVTTLVNLEYKSNADSVDTWNVTGGAGNNIIERTSGSFIADGIAVNDTIDYYIDITAAATVSGRTVLNVTDTYLVFDGAAVTNQTDIATAGVIVKTDLENFDFDYNLPTNDEGDSFLSRIDGLVQSWRTEDVKTATPSFVNGTYQSSKQTSLDTAEAYKMRHVQDISGTFEFIQQFELVHTIRVKPFYLDGELTSLQNGDAPSYLIGDKTFNYLFRLNANTNDDDPNEKKQTTDNSLGNVGWFNEQFNGQSSHYTLDSITLTDDATALAVDSLQKDRKTNVVVRVKSDLTISGTPYYGVGISKLPTETEYLNKNGNFTSNFIFDSAVEQVGAAAFDSDFIKNIRFEADPTTPTEYFLAKFDVEFSAAQQLLIDETKSFVMWIGCCFAPKPTKRRTNLVVLSDNYQFNTDVTGLVRISDSKFKTTTDTDVSTGYSNVKRWKESEFQHESTFAVDLNLNAIIRNLRISLVAFNTVTEESFEIEAKEWDFSDTIVKNDSQQIDIDTTRGFKLADGNIFNFVKITTGAKVGTEQFYTIKYGYKAAWMDYKKLLGVSSDFYDVNLLNKGTQDDTSRYSGSGNWVITVFQKYTIGNSVVDTDYLFRFPSCSFLDYDDSTGSADATWTAAVQTFTEDGVNEYTGGLDAVNKSKIVITFTPDIAVDTTLNYWGIIRCEKYRAGGRQIINQLSSDVASASNNPLEPLTGESYTKVTNNGSTVVIECLFNPENLPEAGVGEDVHISGEIGLAQPITLKLKEDGTAKKKEDGSGKILE